MGRSQEEKAKTHQLVVKTASKAFREKGFDGLGLADLMKEAGLTVGGFYKHFESKDALIQEAMADATDLWTRKVDSDTKKGKTTEFIDLLNHYMSVEHKNNVGAGCPFAALSSEMRRCDDETRSLLTEKLSKTLELLTGLLGDKKKKARQKAIVTYSTMIGAVTLARLVDDERLSDEIRKTVQESLAEFSST